MRYETGAHVAMGIMTGLAVLCLIAQSPTHAIIMLLATILVAVWSRK